MSSAVVCGIVSISVTLVLNYLKRIQMIFELLQLFYLFAVDCLAYLLTYIPGQLLISASPLSEQHLYELGELVAELTVSLKVLNTHCL